MFSSVHRAIANISKQMADREKLSSNLAARVRYLVISLSGRHMSGFCSVNKSYLYDVATILCRLSSHLEHHYAQPCLQDCVCRPRTRLGLPICLNDIAVPLYQRSNDRHLEFGLKDCWCWIRPYRQAGSFNSCFLLQR